MQRTNKTIVILDQAPGFKQIDILEAYQLKYEKCVIIAGSVNERRKKLPEGVVWERIIKYNPTSNFKRLYTWVIGTIQMLWLVKTKYRNAELLIITNPPLDTFIPLIVKNTYDIWVFDLYPDAFVEYKYITKQNWIFKIWAKANKITFQNARRLITLSDGMKEKVSEYVNGKEVEVIPVWTDNIYIKPLAQRENPFIQEQNLQGKFIVLFHGNLGRTHPVEVMVDLAEKMKHNNDYFFLIVGGGHKQSLLKRMIDDSGLDNIRLLGWQPTEVLPFSMSSGNVGIVTLDPEASKLSVPSRVLDLFSVGMPVLAIAAEDSELANLVSVHKVGICCASTELNRMVEFLNILYENQSKYAELATNSLQASNLYSPKNAMSFL